MDRFKAISVQTFSSMRIRNYRLYFIGQAISLSGTWMQTIAQSWLILKLTGSGTALGLITALQFLPVLILAPFGGVIADKFSKRKILYITQTSAGVTALLLGFLVVSGFVHLWMIYVLALTLGIINSFDSPARQTFVVEMVGKDELKNAISLNSVEVNLARVIGPAIAGLLIVVIGIGACFIINGVSYAAVLLVLYMMDKEKLYLSNTIHEDKVNIIGALKYVMKVPAIKIPLFMMAIIGTLAYEFTVTLPLLAQNTFHGDAQTYASLTSLMGIGSVIGGIYTARNKNGSIKNLTFFAFLFGISIILLSISPTLPFALICMLFIGIFSINFIALGNTILQLGSRADMRGRVMSLWTIAFVGSTPIGGPIVGFIGQLYGIRWSLAIGGIATILACILGLLNIPEIMQFLKQNLPGETSKLG